MISIRNPPGPPKKRLRRLKRLSKRHSRRQKGSMKRRKSAMCQTRLHRRIRNCSLDFLRKTTTHLARTKRVIVVEDLAVKNLTKSARGTKSKPGSRVRQKSGLNRSILDQGWGVSRRMTESSSGSHARRDSSDGGTDTSPVYESRVVEAGSERWISPDES